ncbi:unnamed protein product [Protopolystoma xenopodis]|uniref:Uncharacterized protein n=1 Tax=Protopolystoma xenopodis TaxID=117903 RepID=A0A448X010_9PLAT|nr:unnamed protein product [Protopolystoma xenopodis]
MEKAKDYQPGSPSQKQTPGPEEPTPSAEVSNLATRLAHKLDSAKPRTADAVLPFETTGTPCSPVCSYKTTQQPHTSLKHSLP